MAACKTLEAIVMLVVGADLDTITQCQLLIVPALITIAPDLAQVQPS